MALSIREMFLIVRAQDQASRTLASVGRNLSALGRQSHLVDRAMMLNAQRASLQAENIVRRQRRAAAIAGGDPQQMQIATKRLEANRMQLGRNAAALAAFEQASRNVKWQRITSGLHAISDIGRTAQYGGAIATGVLGAMAYSAANFNTEIVRASTQTGKSFQDIIRNAKALEPAVVNVMRHSASSSQELTGALYEIFSSMDVTRRGGVRLLRLLSDAAIGGMAPLEDVTKGVITVMNNFGKSVSDAPGFLNRMFAAVRFGRTTFDEFAQTLSTTVPAAHQQNQSFSLMSGTIAFLTRNLGNVSRASVGYARALEVLNRQKTVDNFKAVGVAIRDTHNRMLPLPQVLQNITRRFPGLITGTKDWQNILSDFAGTQGTIQARRALTELTNDMSGYRSVVRRVSGDNNEFVRSVRAMRQTPGVQFREFVNQLKAFSIELGRGAIPAFQKMIGFIEGLLGGFHRLNAATQGSLGNFLTWGAALTATAGTALVLTGALGRLLVPLRALGPAGAIGGALLFGRAGRNDRLFLAGRARAAREAELALGGAAATGGLAGMGTRAAAAFRTARTESGILRSTLAGAAAAAGGLGVSAGVLAVALPAAAVAGGLLYMHMRAAREQAERLAEAQQRFRSNIATSIGQPLAIAAQGPGAFLRARDQLLNLKEVNAQIRIQRRDMEGLKGAERDLAQVNLSRLLINRRTVLASLHRSTVAVRDAEQNFSRALEGTNRAQEQATRRFVQLRRLRREEARIEVGGISGPAEQARITRVRAAMRGLQAEMTGFRRAASQGFAGLDNMVSRAVQALRAVRAIPRLPRGAIGDLQQFARQIGRFPRLKEIKALIRAEIDPSSLKNAPATIQRFFRSRPVHIPVALETRALRGTSRVIAARARATARQLAAGPSGAPTRIKVTADTAAAIRQAEAARQKIAQSKTRIPVGANTSSARSQVGALIQWINSQTATLDITVNRTTVINEVNRALGKPTSPFPVIQKYLNKHPNFLRVRLDLRSLLSSITKDSTKRDVRQALSELVDTGSRALLDKFKEFQGMFQEQFGLHLDELNQIRFDWGVALKLPDLTKSLKKSNTDLRDHFRDMRKLMRSGVPRGLILQLLQMGPEGESIMDSLAGATPRQRRNFIRAWRQNQRLINRATMQAFHVQLKQWRRLGRSMAIGIILGLKDEEAGLYRYFRRLFMRLLRHARNSVGAHSPAMAYHALGRDIVAGLERGLATGNPMVRLPGVSGGYGATHVTQNIYAQRDQSLDSTMRKASFRLRNQLR